MDRPERFYKIEELLRQRKAVSFDALLSELEVSRSTLVRDLAYLRERLHTPIEWDKKTGYRLAEASNHADRPHQLPGLWFSSAEIHALLTMQHLLLNLDAGGVLTPHVAPLIERLNTLREDGEDHEAEQLRRRVRIIGLAQRAVQPTHFQRVGTALVQRKRLALRYQARGSGQATEREVSALRLVRLFKALEQMFEHDRSAARGEMSTRGLYVFKHDSELGNAPAHALFDRLKTTVKEPGAVVRDFSGYTVEFDGQALLPAQSVQAAPGVTLTRLS